MRLCIELLAKSVLSEVDDIAETWLRDRSRSGLIRQPPQKVDRESKPFEINESQTREPIVPDRKVEQTNESLPEMAGKVEIEVERESPKESLPVPIEEQ